MINYFYTVLFGFVCHPFLVVAVVVTQLLWSMWIYDADLMHPPVAFHLKVGLAAVFTLAACLYCQCRPRSQVKYHSEWSFVGGRLFQGQLKLGMHWTIQLLCGACVGAIVSLIDESEVLATLVLSPAVLDSLREEFGPRAGVPHMSHSHDALLILFVLHGWFWTLLLAGCLGAWSNAARVHRSKPVFTID